jgi:hypothetical protein
MGVAANGRLEFGRCWTDASAMLRANMEVVTAVAGMFILLPGILSGWFLPEPPPAKPKASLNELIDINAAYITEHWPAMLASALCVSFGSLALLALLLHRTRPTVSEALKIGGSSLPSYILANLLQSFLVVAGLFFFLVPGLYLIARFICVAPVAAVEAERNPLAIVARSFAVTRGNGWRILLLIAVILLVALVLSSAVGSVAGITAKLLLPPELARLTMVVVSSLIETVLAVVILAVSAAIYHDLDGQARA